MRRPRALTARSIATNRGIAASRAATRPPRDVAAEQKRRGRAEHRADERVDHAADQPEHRAAGNRQQRRRDQRDDRERVDGDEGDGRGGAEALDVRDDPSTRGASDRPAHHSSSATATIAAVTRTRRCDRQSMRSVSWAGPTGGGWPLLAAAGGTAAAAVRPPPSRRRRRRLRVASPRRAALWPAAARASHRLSSGGRGARRRSPTSAAASRRRRRRLGVPSAGQRLGRFLCGAACFAARSARRRSRHLSASADGIGVSTIARQSNVTSGFCASSARRTAGSNGSRPTLTSGGERTSTARAAGPCRAGWSSAARERNSRRRACRA